MFNATELDCRASPMPQVAVHARRDADGGSGLFLPHYATPTLRSTSRSPTLDELQLARLRIRMEALEHLIIILLADTITQNLDAVRRLVNDIPFRTDPNLDAKMNRAAAHMICLVCRTGFHGKA